MTSREKILAAVRKFGPMTVKQVRKHVNLALLSTFCSQLAKRGELKILGGGERTSIYGLPGQKLQTTEVDAAPVRKMQRKTPTSPKRPRAAREAPKLRMKNAALRKPYADAASTFRAALASDGAMIFLGAAAGAFELNRGETRAMIDFVRTLDRGEAAA